MARFCTFLAIICVLSAELYQNCVSSVAVKKKAFLWFFASVSILLGTFWAKVLLVQNPGRIPGQFGRFLMFWSTSGPFLEVLVLFLGLNCS